MLIDSVLFSCEEGGNLSCTVETRNEQVCRLGESMVKNRGDAEQSCSSLYTPHAVSADERGGLLVIFGIVCAILVGLTVLLYLTFGVVVPPDKIGVRRNYFSLGFLTEGYVPQGLSPGRYLRFPGVSDIILLPRGFLFVNLNREAQQGDIDLAALEVPTTDGSKVYTDVTMVVRLFDSPETFAEPVPAESVTGAAINNAAVPLSTQKSRSHGGPAELITFYRDDLHRQLEKFSQTAKDELRRKLSELSTIDFYNPKLREEAAVAAHEKINRDVNPHGLQLWGTLVRRYTYADEEIDAQIFAKNLQTQTERYRAATTKLEEATAQITKTKALWTAKIADLKVSSENYRTLSESEGRLYEETKIAEGKRDVQVKQSEVLATQSKLLAEIPSANIYLAREMAPLLRTLAGGVISGLDPYNIDDWVGRLVGDVPVKKQ